MTKKELRELMRIAVKETPCADRPRLSAELCDRVKALGQWQEARCVLLYYPMNDEIDVRSLLEDALQTGKRVLLPVVHGEELLLVEYSRTMRRGALGVQEPVGEPCDNLQDIDLVVVPGRAFDASGHRLGRGKGYYDRLLTRMTAYRIGVCFPCQMLDEVPFEEHDVLMDKVLC